MSLVGEQESSHGMQNTTSMAAELEQLFNDVGMGGSLEDKFDLMSNSVDEATGPNFQRVTAQGVLSPLIQRLDSEASALRELDYRLGMMAPILLSSASRLRQIRLDCEKILNEQAAENHRSEIKIQDLHAENAQLREMLKTGPARLLIVADGSDTESVDEDEGGVLLAKDSTLPAQKVQGKDIASAGTTQATMSKKETAEDRKECQHLKKGIWYQYWP